MGMDIYPARRDDKAGRVDLARALRCDLADCCNKAVVDGDVGCAAFGACAVDHRSAANEKIVHPLCYLTVALGQAHFAPWGGGSNKNWSIVYFCVSRAVTG